MHYYNKLCLQNYSYCFSSFVLQLGAIPLKPSAYCIAILFQKKAEARDLYEQVFYSLDLIEKDYFGLQFTDVNHVKHWLDPTKAIKKQIKSEVIFKLSVFVHRL